MAWTIAAAVWGLLVLGALWRIAARLKNLEEVLVIATKAQLNEARANATRQAPT